MKKTEVIEHLKILHQKSLAIIIILLIWEIVIREGLAYPITIPSPSYVFETLVDMASNGTLIEHVIISLGRVFLGYTLAMMIAIPLGFLIGWYKTFEIYLNPLLQTLRQVPLLAWFPILIVLCGSDLSRVLTIMITAMWWILLSTVSAVQNVDPFIVKIARSLGTSQWDMFRKIVLPSSVPSIFVGLRYAYTDVILILMAIEMGTKTGLGSFIIDQDCHSGPEMVMVYSIAMLMVMIGLIANYILVALERRLCVWKEDINSHTNYVS